MQHLDLPYVCILQLPPPLPLGVDGSIQSHSAVWNHRSMDKKTTQNHTLISSENKLLNSPSKSCTDPCHPMLPLTSKSGQVPVGKHLWKNFPACRSLCVKFKSPDSANHWPHRRIHTMRRSSYVQDTKAPGGTADLTSTSKSCGSPYDASSAKNAAQLTQPQLQPAATA